MRLPSRESKEEEKFRLRGRKENYQEDVSDLLAGHKKQESKTYRMKGKNPQGKTDE